MPTYPKFSCFIIGEGTLPLQCAELLRQREHHLYGLISPDPLLEQWARDKNIPYLAPTSDLLAFISQQPFDYLFSIVNSYILPPEILARPRRQAINYHDAPLPRYAGSHATSWAIMQQETSHAVTWHIMTNQIDAGAILKQYPLDIAADETALTLNAKCYAAAINAFAELIDDLAYGREPAKAQNPAKRTYFPLYKRPPSGCVISWQQTAEEIDAFVRALNFGPYPNPLGLPKLAFGQEFVLVTELDTLETYSEALPGTIVSLDDNGISVSTKTHPVILRQFLTIEGQPLPIAKLATRFDLASGSQLAELEPEVAHHLTATYARLCKHEVFWVKRLATLQPVTLPYATPPAQRHSIPVSSPTSSKQQIFLPAAFLTEITTFLTRQQPNWRLDDFLQAAFFAYLTRLSGLSCFDVGFKATGPQDDLAGLEGFFAQDVPLRVELDPTWRFEQIYETTRAQFELTKQHLSYARDVLPRYPDLHAVAELLPDCVWPVGLEQVENLAGYRATSGSEFTLVIARDDAERPCCWVYDPAIIPEPAVTSMLSQFMTLLHHLITGQSEQPLFALPLLTAAEQHRLLIGWNRSKPDQLQEGCIHQLFEAQAAHSPEAVALIAPPDPSLTAPPIFIQLTYRELNGQANQLARHLQVLGVGPETPVAIYMERSPEMIIGLLGILKAGGAYIPLDPKLPKERLAFMLADTQAPIVLTQQRLVDQLPQSQAKIICLDKDGPAIAQASPENLNCVTSPENLAYIIYTSGSTGQPKGVMIQHRSLVNFSESVGSAYELRPGDRVLQFASLSFDAAAEEIYGSLVHGATLVLRTDSMLASTATFWQTCQEWGLTVLDLPTAYWHELITHFPPVQPEQIIPPALRLVIIGGERALPEQLRRWQAHVGHRVRLVNTYGPTEATVVATMSELSAPFIIDPPDDQARDTSREVPIGRPIRHVQAYILDRYLQPVPPGVPGELYLAGIGLARGYLNRPELTAEKFIPNPFPPPSVPPPERGNSHIPPLSGGGEGGVSPRLYKTGDLVRFLPDGNIEFLGRVDHQVKLRGFRIELAEIEAVLNRHPAVREAIVLLREDLPGQQRLVAYIVPGAKVDEPWSDRPAQTSGLPTPDLARDLRHFLQVKLPDYMIPSAFVLLKALPLTPTGKTDRRALPAPDKSAMTTTSVAPHNELEATLAGIWAEVLGLDQVGVEDNFFELGGHSLQAMQLVAKLSAVTDRALSIKLVFAHPTVASLARIIKEMPPTNPDPIVEEKQIKPASHITSALAPAFPLPANGSWLKVERRSLLSLLTTGKINPVDSAALYYLERTELIPDEFIQDWFDNLPVLTDILETSLGRTALIILPRFDSDLYTDQESLLEVIIEALTMARHLGAKTVSLTGLIPSATHYGQAIAQALAGRQDLPAISTGHATTTAAVVLAIKRILQESGRDLAQERVGVLGMGSIGTASLRLMLKCLPHPTEIILCDLYSKLDTLEQVKQEIVADFGFQGTVRVVKSRVEAPAEFYKATLMIGATNVPDVLDITQLKPGSMIVDDSGPHCFKPELAIRRFEEQGDILFTEGGALKSPQPLRELRYMPKEAAQAINLAQLQLVFLRHLRPNPFTLMGCILSSLLSARFAELKPTIGPVRVEESWRHYQMLNKLGFQAADLYCEGYMLAPAAIRNFQRRFGQPKNEVE